MNRASVVAALALVGAAVAAPASAADLAVRVIDLRSAKGDVHFALYDRADGFPKPGAFVDGARARAGADGAETVFDDIEPGTYAIAVYHDENGNGRFDTFLLRLPVEGYGFSNDAPLSFGPPPFDAAAVQVPRAGAEIVIKMRY